MSKGTRKGGCSVYNHFRYSKVKRIDQSHWRKNEKNISSVYVDIFECFRRKI